MKRRGVLAALRRTVGDDHYRMALGIVLLTEMARSVLLHLITATKDQNDRIEEIEGTLEHFRGRIGTLEGRQMAASAAVRAQRAHHPSVGIPEPQASAEAPKPAP